MTDIESRATPGRPVLGVSVLVERQGSVVLVRRGKPPFKGVWSLPGGTVELGEPLAEAAIREMREETGLDVSLGPVQTALDVISHADDGKVSSHFALVVFRATVVGGTLEAGDDAAAAEWVSICDLNDRPMTPGTAELIKSL